jgi:hypothetical protein
LARLNRYPAAKPKTIFKTKISSNYIQSFRHMYPIFPVKR